MNNEYKQKIISAKVKEIFDTNRRLADIAKHAIDQALMFVKNEQEAIALLQCFVVLPETYQQAIALLMPSIPEDS